MGFGDRLKGWFASTVEKGMRSVPGVEKQFEKQYESLLGGLEAGLKPYRKEFPSLERLPETGRDREQILRDMEADARARKCAGRRARYPGAVYHGDPAFIDFLCRVYAVNSQVNALHSDVWPSASKFEADIVAMTAHMLGASSTSDEICGIADVGRLRKAF